MASTFRRMRWVCCCVRKGLERSILVTDGTAAAGTQPGFYDFAGMRIEHCEDGSVREPGSEVLAGSALRLDAAGAQRSDLGICRRLFVIGMMPGTIGTVMPASRARATKSK